MFAVLAKLKWWQNSTAVRFLLQWLKCLTNSQKWSLEKEKLSLAQQVSKSLVSPEGVFFCPTWVAAFCSSALVYKRMHKYTEMCMHKDMHPDSQPLTYNTLLYGCTDKATYIYIQHTVVHAQTKPLSYNTQLYTHRQSHFYSHLHIQHTVVHAQTKPLSYNTQLYAHRQSHFHTTHSCTCTDKTTYIQYMNKDGHTDTTTYKTTHIFLVKVVGIFKNLISWGAESMGVSTAYYASYKWVWQPWFTRSPLTALTLGDEEGSDVGKSSLVVVLDHQLTPTKADLHTSKHRSPVMAVFISLQLVFLHSDHSQ